MIKSEKIVIYDILPYRPPLSQAHQYVVAFFRHLLRTGAIGDFVIVSERQMVKGISRIIAVTGDEAKKV